MSDPVQAGSGGGERTLPMSVKHTGFMVDRLGHDCAPLQFLRELTQNAIEAILATEDQTGEVVWDVDWDMYVMNGGVFKLSVTDTGIGMTGPEMVEYINQLSSSIHEQSLHGNFGVGAKIAAATRNHEGLVYMSWKQGIGNMIHLWRDPAAGDYGLLRMELPDGSYREWGQIDDITKPGKDPRIESHGTKVVLLGNYDGQDTMEPPAGTPSPSRWIGRYLNTRYFRFPDGVAVRAREGWTFDRGDKDRNLLRTITGQEKYLYDHAQSSGAVDLTNATAHWWILRDEKALSSNSGFVASNGHMAALHHDELYEMVTARAGVARLQLFGVIFGYQRVVIYVEPHNTGEHTLIANTSRTNLLLDGEPLPWADWAAEFRSPGAFPKEIADLMEEIVAGTVSSDHKQSIRERLRQIRDLFRLTRYRPSPRGDKVIDETSLQGGESRANGEGSRRSGSASGSGGKGGRSGNIYSMFLADEGLQGEEIDANFDPDVRWVTVGDGTRAPGFLEDRAAKFIAEQNLLQINGDFRVFTDMIDRWCDQYSHIPGAKGEITEVVREWFEQALIETVIGVQALKDSREWSIEDVAKSLSEESLTSAVMPRYHVDVAVRRALGAKLGSLKDKAS